MKKRILVFAAVLCLAAAFGGRLYAVNANAERVAPQHFEKGETVPVGPNYFWKSDENMEGYTMRVTDSWIEPTDQFLLEHKERADLIDAQYLYMVKVEFQNLDNQFGEEAGINLNEYMILGTDYGLAMEAKAYKMANPNMNGTGFSLRLDKPPFELILPFGIYEAYVSAAHVKADPPSLIICAYPEMKLLDCA